MSDLCIEIEFEPPSEDEIIIENEKKNSVNNNDIYLEDINIIKSRRNSVFVKELQKFMATLDLQKGSEIYKSMIKKISQRYGILLQRGNPWLHLMNLKSNSFESFTICWVHLLLEGLFKDRLVNIKLLFNNKYLELLTKNIHNLFHFYSWIIVPNDPLDVKLTAIESLDFSMILAVAIEITEFQYFQIKINLFEQEKIKNDLKLNKKNNNKNNLEHAFEEQNDDIYIKLFENKRDELILVLFKSGNYINLINNYSNWKSEYFNNLKNDYK
ncbi:hypothetical protein M0812_28891 [Anaeramoeba flamelloides]|uniref:Uncharacterized protein n=1 Tax=Anaeramoeba flamelloides TaxID=1746091 RepID=A0AAV7YD20_9EUKA|nr:hypothetical protein M0812_28891 [Anaeramoeba flamelloides]